MTMNDPREIYAKVAANTLLSSSMGTSSELIDRFSIWLLTGFGAAVALILSRLETILAHVPGGDVQAVLWCFALSVLIAIVQRYLAVSVAAGAAGAEHGRQVFQLSGVPVTELDIPLFLSEVSAGFFWPVRRHIERLNTRVLDGDFAATGRLMAKAVQLQSVLVAVQAILLAAAVCTIAAGVNA